MAKALAIP